MLVAMVVFVVWPPPAPDASVADWFAVFRDSPLRGLLNLDLLYMGSWLLLIPLLVALYPALRRFGEAVMAVATVAGLMSIAIYLATNPSIQMLVLSNGYTAAGTDAARAAYVAAGQAMLAAYVGTGYHVSLIVGGVALLLISAVMLRSRMFGTVAPSGRDHRERTGPRPLPAGDGMLLLIGSVLPLFVWQVLVGRRMLQLGGRHADRPVE